MSLSDLQPTIFFASCTLKGLVWIPFAFLPELFLHPSHGGDDDDDGDFDTSIFDDSNNSAEEEALLIQDHHVIFMERLCHYTNIFLLLGLVSFYAVNPRLWRYRYYGWLWTVLLLVQHIPQQLQHEGILTLGKIQEDEFGQLPSAAIQVLHTNRIFSTLGVILFQLYALYYGHGSTIKRIAAEPIFVFGAIITLLLETHITCLFVWAYHTSHPSTAMPYKTRSILCAGILVLLVGLGLWHRQVHPQQLKILRKQLKSIPKDSGPKMKFV